MIISGRYSHNGGEEFIENNYSTDLREVEEIIGLIDAESCRLKQPKDKEINRARRIGETLFYSPPHINALFDWHFHRRGWDIKPRIYTNDPTRKQAYREMDMIKGMLGVEIQMGKYSFLTYDIVAKMVIFKNLELIECGIEICPMASMLPHMSSGIGAFEQVMWDLRARGIADIDVPVLLLGVEAEKLYEQRQPPQPQLFDDIPEPLVSEPRIEKNRYEHLTEALLKKVQETGQIID